MADPFQQALSTLIGLGAERALILQGPAPLQARLSHGFDEQSPWTDQISLGVLERSLQGEPLLLADVRQNELGQRWSVEVSGIYSLVCVPFWSPSSRILGLLYADTRSLRSFSRDTMSAVQKAARQLERALYGGEAPLPESPPPQVRIAPAQAQAGIRLGVRAPRQSPGPAPNPAKPSSSQAALPTRQVKAYSLAIFLRSLATMVTAGLGLHRSLSVLAEHESDPNLRLACRILAHKVMTGANLSVAMASLPKVFSSFDCSLIEVGERTGSLDHVLIDLANLHERDQKTRMRLRSILTYPLILSAFCLVVLLLAPPLVLRGQLELLRQWGQQLPSFTRLLISLSDGLASPIGWMAVIGLAVLAKLAWERLDWRRVLTRFPLSRRLLLHLACSRLTRALGLCYKVGLPLDQSLQLAFRLSGWSSLEKDLPHCLNHLRDGGDLASTLSFAQDLPIGLIQMTRAGEESGKLDLLLAWIADLYDLEFESNMESLLSLVQPILILVMGVCIGVLLLATLLPMVALVQQL